MTQWEWVKFSKNNHWSSREDWKYLSKATTTSQTDDDARDSDGMWRKSSMTSTPTTVLRRKNYKTEEVSLCNLIFIIETKTEIRNKKKYCFVRETNSKYFESHAILKQFHLVDGSDCRRKTACHRRCVVVSRNKPLNNKESARRNRNMRTRNCGEKDINSSRKCILRLTHSRKNSKKNLKKINKKATHALESAKGV